MPQIYACPYKMPNLEVGNNFVTKLIQLFSKSLAGDPLITPYTFTKFL